MRSEVGNAVQAIDDLEGGVALPRVVDLLKGPVSDHAAPVIRSYGFIDFEGYPGLGTHQIELATGTGVRVDGITIVAVGEGNEVGSAVSGRTVPTTGNPAHDRGSQQRFDLL